MGQSFLKDDKDGENRLVIDSPSLFLCYETY